MRWSIAAALGAGLALALLASATTAQNAVGHVLMDMTVRVAPGATEGHCLLLDAGTIEVSLRLVDDLADGASGPPVFALGPYRTRPAQAGSPPEIQGIRVTRDRTTASLPVAEGLYCYSFTVGSTPELDALPSREQATLFRFVTIRMTLTPQ